MKFVRKRVRMVAAVLGILALSMSLMLPSALADVTLGTPNEFLNPLGTYLSWSFEASGYWSTNYGGYFTSAYKLHQSYSWYTTGSSAGNYQMWRYVEGNCLNSIKGKYAMFSFFFLPSSYTSTGSVNNARAVVTVYTASGSSSYYGPWIKPIEFKWHSAHVNAYVSSAATSVKVTIEGQTSFNAYIDVASFAIRDYRTGSFAKGKLSLETNIYEWRIRSADYDGYTFLAPSLMAEAASGYYIRATKLYLELEPLNYYWQLWWQVWYTEQQGQINIEYLHQTNNKGYQVDPGAVEEARNKVLETAETAIDCLIGVGFALLPVTGGLSGTAVLIGLTGAGIASAAKWVLSGAASDPNDRNAYGNTDYSAHEQWDYPNYYKEYQASPFVSAATGALESSWIFRTSTRTNFQLKVVASVNWGVSTYHFGARGEIGYYTLDDAGWDSLTTIISVNA